MKPWRAITRMLSILAILGLVLAPFTAPAVAGGMDASMTSVDIPTGDDVAMAEVPCCAPAFPFMPDCSKACPLAAMCHASIVEGAPAASVMLRWFTPAQASPLGDDVTPDTLAQAPPSRPPRA
jgi:hypothetical protein